jgi:hypothetical protein
MILIVRIHLSLLKQVERRNSVLTAIKKQENSRIKNSLILQLKRKLAFSVMKLIPLGITNFLVVRGITSASCVTKRNLNHF